MSIGAEIAPVVVMALGNEMRGDDAAALEVAARIEGRLPAGVELIRTRADATALLELWKGRELVVVVDAVSGGTPGEVVGGDVLRDGMPAAARSASTHDFGLMQGLELGKLTGELPAHLEFVGVVGARFGVGEAMSPEVEGALEEAADKVLGCL